MFNNATKLQSFSDAFTINLYHALVIRCILSKMGEWKGQNTVFIWSVNDSCWSTSIPISFASKIPLSYGGKSIKLRVRTQ